MTIKYTDGHKIKRFIERSEIFWFFPTLKMDSHENNEMFK